MDKVYAQVGEHRIELGPLDVIRALATRLGFAEVDCEPGVDNFSVTAKHGLLASFTVRGTSWDDCCEKFVDRLLT